MPEIFPTEWAQLSTKDYGNNKLWDGQYNSWKDGFEIGYNLLNSFPECSLLLPCYITRRDFEVHSQTTTVWVWCNKIFYEIRIDRCISLWIPNDRWTMHVWEFIVSSDDPPKHYLIIQSLSKWSEFHHIPNSADTLVRVYFPMRFLFLLLARNISLTFSRSYSWQVQSNWKTKTSKN